MSEFSDTLISEYNAHPVNFFEMDDCTISFHEGNFICGDDITVYLKINNNIIISDFSFSGNPGQVSTASCSLLAEMIQGKTIDEVMTWGYNTFVDQGLDVLPRRRRAVVIGLLGVRNAIHQWRQDKKNGKIVIEEFEDLLDD